VRDLFEGTTLELPRADPGLEHFDLSPDGRSLVFVHDPAARKASSHCCELVELNLRSRRTRVLGAAGVWDFAGPRYSPSGTRLAVVAARRGEVHTAFGHLAVFDVASGFAGHTVPGELDVQPTLRWSADGMQLFFLADEQGRCHVWRHRLDTARTEQVVQGGTVLAFEPGPQADPCIVTLADSALHPPRIHVHAPGAEPRRLERFNDAELAGVELGRVEARTVTGGLGEPVQMWLVYPSGFDPRRRHPVCHVIHGGPYVASGDSFSWRWNAHVLASRGMVVAMVNYHGSSGFGWAFRHAIVGRQGELEGQDLEAVTDWLRRQRWADPARIHAAGGSYGGYLVAWLNGHAPAGRYRSIVCHAGVFDRVATWSADSYTERHRDLGATYWDDPARVQAQSPVTFAGAMHTPTFVTHGALDYRVPDHNGLALYNTLQARGVPARLLWFPDENHWVLKP
ncbi:MAG: prolyl oligopeptidase family serine peptidase, partial [Rubrivivax sp.]